MFPVYSISLLFLGQVLVFDDFCAMVIFMKVTSSVKCDWTLHILCGYELKDNQWEHNAPHNKSIFYLKNVMLKII
jgi:hypothetical protein